MGAVSKYGREVETVFDLLGRREPDLTAALGWTLANSNRLLGLVLDKLGVVASSDDVALHLEVADDRGRTDIELVTPDAHVIFEAKQGWIVPGDVQLGSYAPRFARYDTQAITTGLVTLSDSTPEWAREVLKPDIDGTPVTHWSWDDIRDLIRRAATAARGIERVWLNQLEDYMGAATSRRSVTDSLAYCVVLNAEMFGDRTFLDYVREDRVYFHPIARGGWPTVPPNFLAFRWDNAVRQVNRVVDYEIVATLSDRFPSVRDEEEAARDPWGAHIVYRLGPDIPLPNGAVPSGPARTNLRAQRFWVLVDQLLTQPTVVAAREATRQLGAT